MIKNVLVLAAALASVACIKPPEIVMVDRATALEQQAGGSFDSLEKRLEKNAVAVRRVPFTPDQLEALGLAAPPLVDHTDNTDADWIDEWLSRHCVGEGNDGLLVETPHDCHGATDHDEVVKLVDRVNRARAQLWRWMHDERPDATVEALRKKWREAHVRGVPCDAWVQGDDGKWSAKSC